MRRFMRSSMVAVAVAALIGAGTLVTSAVAGSGGQPGGDAAASAPAAVGHAAAAGPARAALAAAPAPAVSETSFVPITPCRAIDTRPARIGAGATKDFVIRGAAGFAAQGGRSGGCGVPAAATGVAVSVSSVNIGGDGYFRIWPYGQADPGATIAHYQSGPITTTGGTITLGSAGQAYDVTAKAFDAPAGLVVDVTGYYVPPMHVRVSASGAILSGSRVVAVARAGAGQYTVTFDRDVTNCTAQPLLLFGSAGSVVPWMSGTHNDTVEVYAYDRTGAMYDSTFSLTVTC